MIALMTVLGVCDSWADAVSIPQTLGSYISMESAKSSGALTLTNCKVDGSGSKAYVIGSTHKGSVIQLALSNEKAGDYVLSFLSGASGLSAEITVDVTADNYKVTKDFSIENTGSWTPSISHFLELHALPKGDVTMTVTVTNSTGSYAGNYGSFGFFTNADYFGQYDRVPGDVALSKGSYSTARVESAGNVGYCSNGAKAIYTVYNTKDGTAYINMGLIHYGDGVFTVTVTDVESGKTEITRDLTIDACACNGYDSPTAFRLGSVTKGMKEIKLQIATSASFCCNYKNVIITVEDKIESKAALQSVKVGDTTVDFGSGFSYTYEMPYGNTTFSKVIATANESGEVVVTQPNIETMASTILLKDKTTGDEIATYTVFFKPASTQTKVKVQKPVITITEGADADEVTMTSATDNSTIYYTIDGTDPTTSSYKYEGTFSFNANCVFRAMAVASQFNLDNSEIAEAKITRFNAQAGFSYTMNISGGDKAETGETPYAYAWTSNDNPSFRIYSSKNSFGDARWKFKPDVDYEITVPSNAQIMRVIFQTAYENYDGYPNSCFKYIKSEGATISVSPELIPRTSTDIIATVKNHKAGTPIIFQTTNSKQFASLNIIIEYAQCNDGKINLVSTSIAEGAESEVSACMTFNFDRNINMSEGTKVQIDGKDVRTVASGSAVKAYFWNLDYATAHTATLRANTVLDTFGNKYDKDITINFRTIVKPVVASAAYDYVVSTADELKSALTALATSNNSASSARKRVFLKNGTYNMGSEITYIGAYNISLIGQSKDGVIITRKTVNEGMGTSDIHHVNKDGLYMQDISLITDDYGLSTSQGRIIALYNAGQKTILKNVVMKSYQDTYVTGHRTYHEDCEIHGTTDYICGGGDNYFVNNKLYVCGGPLTAASTSSAQQWGYVFMNCQILLDKTKNSDVTYTLGSPWQNEPRVYYLNTKMESQPSDAGWQGMGNLTTHFYEYNSMDIEGNVVSLDGRGNSPNSTNTYKPVLTDAEAGEFDVYNVLGGNDAWNPAKDCEQVAAPTVSLSGKTLNWNAVDDALCYVVFKDGEYVANVTTTSYEVTGEGDYTVCAANAMGGLSVAGKIDTASGVNTIASLVSDDAPIYNILGQRVVGSAKGLVIKAGRKYLEK